MLSRIKDFFRRMAFAFCYVFTGAKLSQFELDIRGTRVDIKGQILAGSGNQAIEISTSYSKNQLKRALNKRF